MMPSSDFLESSTLIRDASQSTAPADMKLVGAGGDQDAPVSSFSLRGHSINQLIDVATPMIALYLRIVELKSFDDVNNLHKGLFNELESIELELQKAGIDRVTILAHRYCLCSFLDEAVMGTEWGQESDWSERSLLATFHNETWGGEKFFVILDRVMTEPERHIHLIEFMYLLLSLGFQGKYRVMHNGKAEIDDLLRDLHEVIRRERGDPPEQFNDPWANFTEKAHIIRKTTSLTAIAVGFVVLNLLVFTVFQVAIDRKIDVIIARLQSII